MGCPTVSTAIRSAEDDLGTKFVKLYVGRKRKAFTVHKRLICKRSIYFSKTFNGSFKEANCGEMYLPEDDPDTVDRFIVWLYSNSLPSCPSASFPDSADGADDAIDLLMKMFYHAEKWCIAELQNKIINKIQYIMGKYGRVPNSKGVKEVYENTAENSMLRIYISSVIAYQVTGIISKVQLEDYAELCSNVPGLAIDVLGQINKHHDDMAGGADPSIPEKGKGKKKVFGGCYFHTHVNGKTCNL